MYTGKAKTGNVSVARGPSLRTRLMKDGYSGLALDIFIYLIMFFILIITLYPFLHTVAVSFNDALDSLRGGIGIIPRQFTLFNYQNLLRDDRIIRATFVSIARTVVGASLNLFACMCLAYVLSRKEYVLRYFMLRMLIFTMFFSSGLIPFFLLMRQLGLVATFWVYVIPGMVSAWNVIIMRSFIENSIPDSLVESARIDGATEFTTLFRIVFPLSLPVVATVVLWTAVGQWNSWFDVSLYNSTRPDLFTLQFELQRILMQTLAIGNVHQAAEMGHAMAQGVQVTSPQATRAAMTIVATLPILMVYPFLQRYFIQGLTLGGVKG